jgi:N-dimethylarginine dimethylaminohydrolase
MEEMGYRLLHVPDDEFEASAGLNLNVLAAGPRRCLAIDGFPNTVELMEDAGCEVSVFQADELCLPCEGGPTCLTRPLHRASV